MFTGIVEETGAILSVSSGQTYASLVIGCSKILEDTKVGDSIAVNGICLTVNALSEKSFTADVMPETIRRSSLKGAEMGMMVNLERAMAVKDRFGGHIVTGHIDGTGTIREIKEEGNAVWYTIDAEKELLKYIVLKGSVTIDGISLTVAKTSDMSFQVSVIPHTRTITNLSKKMKGSMVNIETDIIGKYIEKFLVGAPNKTEAEITEEYLLEHGF